MSHILQGRTKLKFAGQDLARAYQGLAAALEQVVKKHGVAEYRFRQENKPEKLGVTDFYVDWSGQEQRSYREGASGQRYPVKLGIFVKGLERGIGLMIHPKTGELSFVGDSYGVEALYERVTQEIVQTYTHMQFQAVLEELGYSTSVETTTTNASINNSTTVVKGVSVSYGF